MAPGASLWSSDRRSTGNGSSGPRSWTRSATRTPDGTSTTLPTESGSFPALDGDQTVGYLLIWLGHPDGHRRPLGRVRPSGSVPRRCSPGPPSGRHRPRDLPGRGGESTGSRTTALGPAAGERPGQRATGGWGSALVDPVRRLERLDHPALVAFSQQQTDPVAGEYLALDPGEDWIWGAFDQGRLVGAVRAAVRLTDVWFLGGVFVDPGFRGRGVGRALVAAALASAREARAKVGLYVREDRREARQLYGRMGFRPIGRRTWLDLGAGVSP